MHYSGLVEYHIDTFLMKNKDTPIQEFVDLMRGAGLQELHSIFEAAPEPEEAPARGRGRGKKKGPVSALLAMLLSLYSHAPRPTPAVLRPVFRSNSKRV